MQRSSVKLANRASRKIAEQASLSHSGFAAHAAMALIVIVLLVLCLSSSVLAHDIYTDLHDRNGNLCCGRTGLYAGGGYSAAKWQLLYTKDW